MHIKGWRNTFHAEERKRILTSYWMERFGFFWTRHPSSQLFASRREKGRRKWTPKKLIDSSKGWMVYGLAPIVTLLNQCMKIGQRSNHWLGTQLSQKFPLARFKISSNPPRFPLFCRRNHIILIKRIIGMDKMCSCLYLHVFQFKLIEQ